MNRVTTEIVCDLMAMEEHVTSDQRQITDRLNVASAQSAERFHYLDFPPRQDVQNHTSDNKRKRNDPVCVRTGDWWVRAMKTTDIDRLDPDTCAAFRQLLSLAYDRLIRQRSDRGVEYPKNISFYFQFVPIVALRSDSGEFRNGRLWDGWLRGGDDDLTRPLRATFVCDVIACGDSSTTLSQKLRGALYNYLLSRKNSLADERFKYSRDYDNVNLWNDAMFTVEMSIIILTSLHKHAIPSYRCASSLIPPHFCEMQRGEAKTSMSGHDMACLTLILEVASSITVCCWKMAETGLSQFLDEAIKTKIAACGKDTGKVYTMVNSAANVTSTSVPATSFYFRLILRFDCLARKFKVKIRNYFPSIITNFTRRMSLSALVKIYVSTLSYGTDVTSFVISVRRLWHVNDHRATPTQQPSVNTQCPPYEQTLEYLETILYNCHCCLQEKLRRSFEIQSTALAQGCNGPRTHQNGVPVLLSLRERKDVALLALMITSLSYYRATRLMSFRQAMRPRGSALAQPFSAVVAPQVSHLDFTISDADYSRTLGRCFLRRAVGDRIQHTVNEMVKYSVAPRVSQAAGCLRLCTLSCSVSRRPPGLSRLWRTTCAHWRPARFHAHRHINRNKPRPADVGMRDAICRSSCSEVVIHSPTQPLVLQRAHDSTGTASQYTVHGVFRSEVSSTFEHDQASWMTNYDIRSIFRHLTCSHTLTPLTKRGDDESSEPNARVELVYNITNSSCDGRGEARRREIKTNAGNALASTLAWAETVKLQFAAEKIKTILLRRELTRNPITIFDCMNKLVFLAIVIFGVASWYGTVAHYHMKRNLLKNADSVLISLRTAYRIWSDCVVQLRHLKTFDDWYSAQGWAWVVPDYSSPQPLYEDHFFPKWQKVNECGRFPFCLILSCVSNLEQYPRDSGVTAGMLKRGVEVGCTERMSTELGGLKTVRNDKLAGTYFRGISVKVLRWIGSDLAMFSVDVMHAMNSTFSRAWEGGEDARLSFGQETLSMLCDLSPLMHLELWCTTVSVQRFAIIIEDLSAGHVGKSIRIRLDCAIFVSSGWLVEHIPPYCLGVGTSRRCRLACSPPTKAIRVTGFSHVGIVPDDAIGRAGFLGDLSFPPPLHSGAAPYSPQTPSSALKTPLLRVAEISSLTHSWFDSERMKKLRIDYTHVSVPLANTYTELQTHYVEPQVTTTRLILLQSPAGKTSPEIFSRETAGPRDNCSVISPLQAAMGIQRAHGPKGQSLRTMDWRIADYVKSSRDVTGSRGPIIAMRTMDWRIADYVKSSRDVTGSRGPIIAMRTMDWRIADYVKSSRDVTGSRGPIIAMRTMDWRIADYVNKIAHSTIHKTRDQNFSLPTRESARQWIRFGTSPVAQNNVSGSTVCKVSARGSEVTTCARTQGRVFHANIFGTSPVAQKQCQRLDSV
ncbi:hypothetical protein PR048_014202 [Dryococelus australis]|uniref:Uncharacterized protein n=1 Tax=Dryococelus australis TaxID=614101 RepID=A0ABQ9HDQ9_9NEOP|nr:hypothetical protein PR048_014202 [Dryococelus australis]